MTEFADKDTDIIIVKNENDYIVKKLKEILPEPLQEMTWTNRRPHV